MAAAAIEMAHEWLDGLKAAEADVACQAISALMALMTGKGYGSVTLTVHAGKLKNADLAQSIRATD